MKRQHLRALRGRAFRKDRHQLAGAQLTDDLGARLCCGRARSARQKQRFGMRTQPADQRPVAHVVLGNEGSRPDGIDDEDVEKGDVVGGDEAGEHLAVGIEPHAQRFEQLPGPASLQCQSQAPRNEGIDQSDRHRAPNEM